MSPVIPTLRTLEEALRWAFSQGHALVTVVTQDEYTHDVVMRLKDGPFLVFDTT